MTSRYNKYKMRRKPQNLLSWHFQLSFFPFLFSNDYASDSTLTSSAGSGLCSKGASAVDAGTVYGFGFKYDSSGSVETHAEQEEQFGDAYAERGFLCEKAGQ